MIAVHSIADVFPAIEELISLLPSQGGSRLSMVLQHRMHAVTWTTSGELYEELIGILEEAISTDATPLTPETRLQMEKIAQLLNEYLQDSLRA